MITSRDFTGTPSLPVREVNADTLSAEIYTAHEMGYTALLIKLSGGFTKEQAKAEIKKIADYWQNARNLVVYIVDNNEPPMESWVNRDPELF